MSPTYVEESASTAPGPDPATDYGVSTGKFLAALVISAALAAPGGANMIPVVMHTRRGRDEIVAESATAAVRPDRELAERAERLFEENAREFFHDGVQSAFSTNLLAFVGQYGRAALSAISDYLFSGIANPDVVSESLRWLAGIRDAPTLTQRWAILARLLRDRSPRVRDGAVLGFAALDDPRARPLLSAAREVEHIVELRRLIDNAIQQLDATANGADSENR